MPRQMGPPACDDSLGRPGSGHGERKRGTARARSLDTRKADGAEVTLPVALSRDWPPVTAGSA